jgi:hypothetical protein
MRPQTTLLAAIVLAAPGLAQSTPAVVSRVGDVVPGVGTIDFYYAVACNSLGETLVTAHTDNPNNDLARVVLRNGAVMMAAGDTAPGFTGELAFFGSIGLSDNGEALVQASVINEPGFTTAMEVIYFEGFPSLRETDPVGFGGFGPGTTYYDFESAFLNDNRQVLLHTEVLDPAVGILDALVRLDLDPTGQVVNETLLLREGVTPPGQFTPIDVFYHGTSYSALDDNGGGVWSGRLEAAAAPKDDVCYVAGTTLVAQSAGTSPVAGRTWGDIGAVVCAVNASPSWVVRSKLDASDTSNDGLLLKDGAVYLREGDPFPPLGGTTVLDLGSGSVSLTDAGKVGHYARFSGFPGAMDEGLFLGTTVFAREGLTTTMDGELLTGFMILTDRLQFSDDGRFCVFEGELDGSFNAIMLAENIATTNYCTAELNSTGGVSFMAAIGGGTSVLYGNLWLGTFNLPPSQFTYALVSQKQGDVLFPPGSQGRLCLGGSIGRYVAQVQQSGPFGTIVTHIDLGNLPIGGGLAIQPGETWNFQTWHRDLNPGPTSNFSRAIEIEFH